MGFFTRIVSLGGADKGRIRELTRALATDPTAAAYAALAHEQALRGDAQAAARTAREGLGLHAHDEALQRLLERATTLLREARLRELAQELSTAPRPALRAELCALLLEAGRLERAEEAALEWSRHGGGADAWMAQAEVRARRYFADRRREDARTALDLCSKASAAAPADLRPLRLRLELCARVGAYAEALRSAAKLLELSPGDAVLEVRHRTFTALAPRSSELDTALREVERTGRLADEVATPAVPDSEASSRDEGAQPAHVRDMLTACVERDATVQFACAQRGSTALIHGEKGASAERAARGAREITTASRALARKLGLGALREVRCEHAFDDQTTATVLVQASDHSSAAARVTGTAHERHTRALVAMVHALDTGAAR
jgi:tetratricopeptide (TPR) repeat protein